MSSATFRYQGRDRLGKRVRGVVEGASPEAVKARLRRKGILAEKVIATRASDQRGGRIRGIDLVLFTRQLATMIRAGVPLVQSFSIVAGVLSNPAMKGLVLGLQDEVASGTAFATALRRHPKIFDALYCNLVDAGEQAGALEGMLDRLATYREKGEALRGKVRKALTYPMAVLAIALVVTGFLLIKVVPQFELVFAGFGAVLPPLHPAGYHPFPVGSGPLPCCDGRADGQRLWTTLCPWPVPGHPRWTGSLPPMLPCARVDS